MAIILPVCIYEASHEVSSHSTPHEINFLNPYLCHFTTMFLADLLSYPLTLSSRSELTAVQEQYVSVCIDKERLEAELVQLRNREQSLSTNDALEKVVDLL